MDYPLPENEPERLSEIHRYDVLDTPPEESFDRITRLAAHLFEVPIALITLIDEDRQWFKSCFGLDVRESGRDSAFCAHTIMSDEVMVIEDATQDPRFAENPFVTESPGIRFYAGAPLRTPQGFAIGTLCLIDTEPRTFVPSNRRRLQDLAAMVMDELELRRQIAERKEAEAEAERFFNLALDMLCVSDADGTFLRVNPQFEATLGYTADELTGQSFLDLVHPEDQAATRHAIEQMQTGEPLVDFVNRWQCKDGSYRIFEWRAVPIDEGQKVYAAARDITDRKQAEQALLESEERFRSLVSNLPGVVYRCTYDAQWNTLYMSKGFRGICGYPGDPFRNNEQSFKDIVVEEDLPRIREAMREAVREQGFFDIEYRIRTEDGEQRWIADVGRPSFAEDGAVKWLDGVMFDVTARKETEERLRLLETAVSDTAESVLITDAQLDRPGPRIVYVNPGFESMTGYKNEDVMGKTPRILQGPETDETLLRELRSQLEDGGSFFGETINYRKDGTPFVNEWSISPVQGTDGSITHYVAVQRDITERKQTERKMQDALEKERELSKLKSRFVSMASHELRTPLATIQSSAELAHLFMQRAAGDRAEKHLDRIQKNVQKMTELLSDVLLFGRAESGRLPFDPELLNLQTIATELVNEVRQGIGAEHTIQTAGLRASIPMTADEQLLQLILSNLLSNAVKYSAPGSVVRLNVQSEKEIVRLVVSDEGIGIPEHEMDRLFEPFHRAENVGTTGGTGLGLSILKEAVELHQGTVNVESAVGEGTTITVTLPMRVPAPVED